MTFTKMVAAVVIAAWVSSLALATDFPVEELSIEQLHAAYRSGKTTATEAVQQHLARIAAYDKQGPLINALVTVNPRALEEAAALDAKFRKTGKFVGPLHGVPVIIKDNVDVLGMPMTSGFQGWKNYFPPSDATLAKKIRDAGGIVIAKASLSEFARGGGDNINSVVPGYARNPYNTAFATGGSSGGTGASLASSFGVVGIGTDTGGSVRMPSAHNALVGLRPTVGLVSRTGMVPLDSVRDTAGPMARSVSDMATLLNVIVGADGVDAATARSSGHIAADYTKFLKPDGLKGARLGVLRQIFTEKYADKRVIAQFERTIAELKAAGADIVDPFTIPELDSIPRPPQTAAQFKSDLTKFIAAHPGIPYPSVQAIADSRLVHPLHQQGFDQAATAKPIAEDPETIEGSKNEQRYREVFTKAMDAQRIDAVIFPTWAQLPALNGDRNTQITNDPKPAPNTAPTALGSSLTFVGSSLQWPALSVPNGYLGEGLPTGLQILGRAWDEAKLVQYAYAYEQVTHYRHPPSSVPPLAMSAAGKLVGTWQLLSITERDASGATVSTRPLSNGQLIYTPNGRLSVQIMKLGRSAAVSGSLSNATPEELKSAIDGVSSYFGTWELLAGEDCVMHVQAGNLSPNNIGQRAKRCYSFDALGRLSLSTPLREFGKEKTSTVFTWEKIY